MDKFNIVSIVGARPNFIKLAALSPELRNVANEVIIHTGQHHDYELSKIFFDEMGIPEPNTHLNIVASTHGAQTGRMLMELESSLSIKNNVDAVIVFGDTNSTLAGALAAAKLHIPVIHIESGVRSYDKRMPEEINRVIVDHISDMLFCPTWNAASNLAIEGISPERVFLCGDVMVDLMAIQSTKRLTYKNYYLLTIHREDNDNLKKIKEIFKGLSVLQNDIVFPCHPRMKKYIKALKLPANIHVIDPVGYFEMRALEEGAIKIFTDSGGVQKEAYLLKVPCITLRDTTEWIETLHGGWNILTSGNSKNIHNAILQTPKQLEYYPDSFGNIGVCKRIADKIVEELHG